MLEFAIHKESAQAKVSEYVAAFQALIVSRLVMIKQYAKGSEQEFTDRLTASLWGERFMLCLGHFDRYTALEQDRKEQNLLFGSDVGLALTDGSSRFSERSFVASQIYHLVENTCIAVAEFFGDAQTLEELRKASESKDQGLQIKGTVKGKEFSGAHSFARAFDELGEEMGISPVTVAGEFEISVPQKKIAALQIEQWGAFRYRLEYPKEEAEEVAINLDEIDSFCVEGVAKTERIKFVEGAVVAFFDSEGARMDSVKTDHEGYFCFKTNIKVFKITAQSHEGQFEQVGPWDSNLRLDMQLHQ